MKLTITGATCAMLALVSPFVFAFAVDLRSISIPSVTSVANESVGSGPSSIQARTVWVNGAPDTEWPLDEQFKPWGKPLHVIPLCMANGEAKAKLQDQVWQATQAWMQALGGDPYEQDPRITGAGHSVTFLWLQMNCYKEEEYKNEHDPGTWNLPEGWDHAVAIHLSPSGTSAKAGYLPEDKVVTLRKQGRHSMSLAAIQMEEGQSRDLTAEQLSPFVHELGHGEKQSLEEDVTYLLTYHTVLGLGHAHQHPDAPVKIRCENLPNMDWVIDYAMTKDQYQHYKDIPDGKKKLQDYLCTPEHFHEAVFAGCSYTEYITNRPGMTVIGPYDADSIMHYPTWMHWKDDQGNYHDEIWKAPMPWDPSKATMTHVLPDGVEEPFREPTAISKGDIAAVKSRYPA
jgi:hypothetical protein